MTVAHTFSVGEPDEPDTHTYTHVHIDFYANSIACTREPGLHDIRECDHYYAALAMQSNLRGRCTHSSFLFCCCCVLFAHRTRPAANADKCAHTHMLNPRSCGAHIYIGRLAPPPHRHSPHCAGDPVRLSHLSFTCSTSVNRRNQIFIYTEESHCICICGCF